jgi:5'-nucleotidase
MSNFRKCAAVVAAIVVITVSSIALTVSAGATGSRRPLRIMVTNDDGVGAPGIAAVVDALQNLKNVEVRVVAPATNQSGTGGNFSTTPLVVTPATTASGDPATAVAGFPADTVLYDVLGAHADPDLVVSGINQGQNLGNITELSGTVGAARQANRLGIPAIAVSQGLAANIDYSIAARLVALVVGAFRHSYQHWTGPGQTLNLNVPSCTAGSVRGIRLLPLGLTSRVSDYTVQSGTVGNGTFAPVIATQNAFAPSDCLSTLKQPTNDIEAFNNGFVTATILNPDYTDPSSYSGLDWRWYGIQQRLAGAGNPRNTNSSWWSHKR